MKSEVIRLFTTSLPTRRGALVFFWIAVACVCLSIGAIQVAEAFMPDNQHGQQAILTFYRSFGPMALFWLIGACCSGVYIQHLKAGKAVDAPSPS